MVKDPVKSTVETYDAIAKVHFDKYSDEGLLKIYLDYMIKHISGKSILDIGCGFGRDAKYLSERGFDVIGIDLSSNQLKIAKNHAPKAKFVQMDMRKLNFEDNTFDGIFAAASLVHLPKNQIESTLKEFFRVIKSKSILFVTVKKGTGESFSTKDYYAGNEKFFAYYSEDEIINLIESVGFKVKKILPLKGEWINIMFSS
jgi:ubiquinone/menaquinone biosynthesis C-methylase UbiE